jgi:hypothetical protein
MCCLESDKKNHHKQQMIRKPCVCYSCTEHREAPRSNDPWVNLIRDMIRDGRLKHIGMDENGKNMYQAN